MEQKIGVYRILKTLGGGNMGVVYLVEDTEGGGMYALKRLSASLSPSEREVRRFRREFMTLSRLRHPHIVEVYESGIDHESLYFVMEYVQGPTLRQHFIPGSPPEEPEKHADWLAKFNTNERILNVLNIAIQICDALTWIHNYGIIHRDLKPENILLKSAQHIKLLDFGIAKRYGGQEETSQSRSIMGTLTYISPEQAQCVDVDGRSDLYTLGVILYELLTGRPPFMSPEPIGRIYMHLNHQPSPLREWNPHIAPALEDIVLKLLNKDPWERYQRAEDVREALEVLMASSGVDQPGAVPGLQVPQLRISDPAFVGRHHQREELLQQVDDLKEMRRGGFVLLSGGSGIGKTRLARELMSSARSQQVECYLARCYKESPPYTAYQEIMEQVQTALNARDDMYTERMWGSLAETWFSMMYQAGPSEGIDAHTPSIPDASGEKHILFDTLRQMLERILQEEPMLIVLDDLMFADETSLELTEYLVKHLIEGEKSYPLMILGIFRNEDVNMEHPLNQCLMRLSTPQQLYRLYDLPALSQQEVVEMASSMLGLPPAPQTLEQLMLQSQGIPFFVEELLKAWDEDEQMVEGGDCWYLLANAFAEENTTSSLDDLPPTLQKRLLHRLQRISEAAKTLATWIAICGQEASFEMLLCLTGWNESDLLSCLEQLLQHKILAEDWTAGIERYRFYHPGIPKTLLSPLASEQKQQYHLQAAHALKQSQQVEVSFELLAHHFLEAGEISQGAWYLLLAAEQQLRALASHSAEELLVRCKELLRDYPNEPLLHPESSWWLRYHTARLEWLESAGRYRDGLESLTEALAEFPGSLDPTPFLRWQAAFYRNTGDYGSALECIQKALAHTPTESEWRPPILQEAGRIYRIQGKHSAALETLREALSWAIAKEQHSQQGRLYGLIGEVLHQKGEYAEAKMYYQRSLETATQHNDRYGEIEAICRVASLELDRGQTVDTLQHLEHSLSLAREVGARQLECVALSFHGQLSLARKQYSQAQQTLREALTMSSELGIRRLESELLGYLGILFYCDQRYPSARIYLEEGLQKAIEVGAQTIEHRIRIYLCVMDVAQQQRPYDQVVEELEQLLRQAEQSETLETILLARIMSAHVHGLSHNRSVAEDELIAARYLARESGHFRLLAAVEQEQVQLSQSLQI